MKRFAETSLKEWFHKTRRKPLVIRGARQVGKSTLVENFARSQGLDLVTVNLERHTGLDKIFKTKDVQKILAEIEALTNKTVSEQSLLFLDEIQAIPQSLACLRYFLEDYPQIPVIAAGSLLEFVLSEYEFSMPVGRVEYFHLGPMTFLEFLFACQEDKLASHIQNFSFDKSIPEMAHERLVDLLRKYLFIGGMPEAVLEFVENKSLSLVQDVHRSILQTYQDDFHKYSRKSELRHIQTVFNSLTRNIGCKVKYSNFSADDRSKDIKRAISLLRMARVLMLAYHSDCSGVPLRAGIKEKVFKAYFLDVGLLNALSGLSWREVSQTNPVDLINQGSIAEQFVAQHLAYSSQGKEAPELFYWLREAKSLNAEVDFVTTSCSKLIPIEVKAGKSGRLKSLHQFVLKKRSTQTCRFDLNLPSLQEISVDVRSYQKMEAVSYVLNSLPLYLVEWLASADL